MLRAAGRGERSTGAPLAFSILYQLPFLFIRFPLEDAISVELKFFDAFPDVIQCSERELRRVISSYILVLAVTDPALTGRDRTSIGNRNSPRSLGYMESNKSPAALTGTHGLLVYGTVGHGSSQKPTGSTASAIKSNSI